MKAVKSLKHYAVLGTYLGVVAAVMVLVRALPELPRKLSGTSFVFFDFMLGAFGTVLVLASVVLLGTLVGWLVGWLKLNTEKRRHASKETLVVRR